ncbi:carbohydrate esterase family 16 [Lecanosticta acicola]|uniref:Carbohydrate esterase family 16 n=1 Tax=Lecanosticta acicola TaxID=111012 RepID=A0AAI8Z5C5_9PEZI|nr:carbohydrate esterase family 16 [Lecanosticta acicola]
MTLTGVALLSALGLASAWGPPSGRPDGPWGWEGRDSSSSWDLKKFTTLVAFGDSYTDDSRLSYISAHNGSLPPVGYDNPPNYAAADGGRVWPQYVKQYTGANLYNYAVAGAVCSNDITPKTYVYLQILFPAVQQYEIPAYLADYNYTDPNGQKFMTAPPNETVYSIWIGANDLGSYAFITDSQVQGTNLVNSTDCVYAQIQRLYDNGGRYFVVQNVPPLNLAPLYALPEKGGVTSNYAYWPDKPSNLTEISYRMMEQVATTNAIHHYRSPFEVELTTRFQGARFAVYDVNGLMTDIYNSPAEYLNGTAPLNVTGVVHRCDATGNHCVTNASPDSYLWYDDLHPSEQTERVIAREFVNVVKGTSRWAMYWGGEKRGW